MTAKIYLKMVVEDGDTVKSINPNSDKVISVGSLGEGSAETTINVAGSATNVALTIAPVDGADILYIETDQTITIKKQSSSGEVWTIQANRIDSTYDKKGFLFMTTNGVTSLYFSNAGTDTAHVKIIYYAITS